MHSTYTSTSTSHLIEYRAYCNWKLKPHPNQLIILIFILIFILNITLNHAQNNTMNNTLNNTLNCPTEHRTYLAGWELGWSNWATRVKWFTYTVLPEKSVVCSQPSGSGIFSCSGAESTSVSEGNSGAEGLGAEGPGSGAGTDLNGKQRAWWCNGAEIVLTATNDCATNDCAPSWLFVLNL